MLSHSCSFCIPLTLSVSCHPPSFPLSLPLLYSGWVGASKSASCRAMCKATCCALIWRQLITIQSQLCSVVVFMALKSPHVYLYLNLPVCLSWPPEALVVKRSQPTEIVEHHCDRGSPHACTCSTVLCIVRGGTSFVAFPLLPPPSSSTFSSAYQAQLHWLSSVGGSTLQETEWLWV